MNMPYGQKLLARSERAWKAGLLALVLSGPAWAQTPPAVAPLPGDPAADPTPVVTEAPFESRQIFFDEDLQLPSDLMMQGIAATETISFRVPRSWDLRKDPILHLAFDHSEALTPESSTLTVWVNNQGVASVPLTEANTKDGRLDVRIPRSVLYEGGYNDIKLKVVQHVKDECEDPFDPALWTRISLASSIDFAYQTRPFVRELGEFPYPYHDELAYGPLTYALGGSGNLSSSQLEAAGILAFALGRHADYRGITLLPPVANPAEAKSHLIVIGTPDENPLVASLVDRSSLRAGVGTLVSVPNPADHRYGILVVTGGDTAGVIKAAEALAARDRHELITGPQAEITNVDDARMVETARKPLPLPLGDAGKFTLESLGIKDTTTRGYYSPPIRIPIRMEGDAQVQIDGARIGLDYAYAANLDTRLSTMEVRLDDVTLRSLALNEAEGEAKERLWVDLPFELVKPDSNLEIIFHLFPKNFEPCVYTTDKHIWGTVFASTELQVARDRVAELPDLGLFQYEMWPLNTALSDDGLTVVVSDRPTLDDLSAAMQVLGDLGASAVAADPKFRLVPGGASVIEETGAPDLLVLVGEGQNSTYKALLDRKVVASQGELERTLTEDGKAVLDVKSGSAVGIIEQVVLQSGAMGRTAMILRSAQGGGLLDVAQRLGDPSVEAALKGNLVVLAGDKEVRPVASADKTTVGHRPLKSRIKQSIRGSWGLLGLGVLIAAILLAMLIQGWAARRGGQTG